MLRKFCVALFVVLLPMSLSAATTKKKTAKKPTPVPTAEATKVAEPTPVKTESATPEPTVKPTEAAPEAETRSDAKTKSVGLGVSLAIIPGIAVHGAGHLYAGSYLKGSGLILVEAASIAVGLRYYEQFKVDIAKLQNTSGAAQNGLNISGAITSVGIMSVCAFGFVYSWFDDMFGVATAVEVYNKKAEAEAKAKVTLLPYNDGALLAVTHRF